MRSTESGFNEEVYLAAAQEQLAAAEDLFRQERYVAAAYLAGVAVELLFLAYLTKAGKPLGAGHDLFGLAESSGFLADLSPTAEQRITTELHQVALRWRNNHRYRSEMAYREFIVRERLYIIEGKKTTRDDVVIFSTTILLNAAERIISAGVLRWVPSVQN